jgi:hypothetical protein
MLHFKTEDAGIDCGETEATLSGRLLSGWPFEGTDAIETAGCNSNRQHRGAKSREFERMQRQSPRPESEEQQHRGDLVEEQRVD